MSSWRVPAGISSWKKATPSYNPIYINLYLYQSSPLCICDAANSRRIRSITCLRWARPASHHHACDEAKSNSNFLFYPHILSSIQARRVCWFRGDASRMLEFATVLKAMCSQAVSILAERSDISHVFHLTSHSQIPDCSGHQEFV
eukprot:Blabericola_migrator_1__13172@NODE_903_length_6138_cov_15_976281_g620_i1_p5_GENE_NODE_903_length_6138_cov_15_976281_g620_i1NODE_903_length_6138_cov_15_976281_g620_i1_p5_ORF_typecomplete_len145_score5_49Rif1_N/PF12231_8/0_01_NODE_903_length_6138_cov_15_976281_g620_i142414675